MLPVPVQKSVRERHFMNHLVTCLVNVSSVNRESVQKRCFWEHFVTELVVPISAGEVFERDRLQHILPASASCAR